jgi:hypothetical protein
MKLMNFNICILVAATAIPAFCQIKLSTYKGDGYYVSYPSNWKTMPAGSAFKLLSPDKFISVQILSSPDTTKSEFWQHYLDIAPSAVGFDITWESGTEPTAYGAWLGETRYGRGKADSATFIVKATAIEANDHFYLLQLVAPLEMSWKANEYLMALGRTLTFKSLPKYSTGTGLGAGEGCANCLQIWSSAMDRITAATVNGMR